MKSIWQCKKSPLTTPWTKEVSPANVHPQYPRPQLMRQTWLNLNGLWEFEIADDLETVPFGLKLSKKILVPFPIESALSGVKKQTKHAWYLRRFILPEIWNNKRILLHFGAVDWEAHIYVNGINMGIHRGGYDPFSIDITKALIPNGTQELIVGVFDPSDEGDQPRGKQVHKPRSIWYTPITGIWQTVWLEPVPDLYIESLQMIPDVDEKCLRIKAQVNTTDANSEIEALVTDGQKQICLETGSSSKELILPLSDPKLWSPDSPFLYDLQVSLRDGNKPIDSVNSYFGMRKIVVGKDKDDVTRILLNDQFEFQVGPLDQGYWPDGLYTAPTDNALKYDIDITKELGFNMTRKHAKVEPHRWYYWCDKMGLLVWQDIPSGNNTTKAGQVQFENEMRQIIREYYNHPSIIMWVIFNEAWGQFDDQRMTSIARDLDPYRIISNVSGWHDAGQGDIIDVHCYPGPGWIEAETNRAAVIGEYGGPRLKIDGHTWADQSEWGYFNLSSRKELTDCYVSMMKDIYQKVPFPGVSAAVFTQLTDVEIECNGLLTYDREIVKVDIDRIKAANRGKFESLGKIVVLEPVARLHETTWHYTFEKPEPNWNQPDFDDTNWKSGPAGFGEKGARQATVRTPWTTDDIWLRRHFNAPEDLPEDLFFLVHNIGDAEIYINGVLAAEVKNGQRLYYHDYPVSDEARKAIIPNGNTFAVHTRKTAGAQFIDVGLIGIIN